MSERLVWMDGKLVPISQAKIPVQSHVVHYATSVFEGIRIYDQLNEQDQPTGWRAIWLLPEHIRRLFDSAALYRLRIPYTPAELGRACVEVCASNPGDSYVRPVVYREVNPETGFGLGVDPANTRTGVAVITAPWGKYVKDFFHHQGASVYIYDERLRPPARMFPGQAKGAAGYGAWSQMAKQAATDNQCSEGLLMAEDQLGERFVVDGSGMNLFIVEQDRLISPDPAKWNVLNGLTRRFILEHTQPADRPDVIVDDVPLARLLAADEAFLVGTATEVTPVTLVKYRQPWGTVVASEIGDGYPGSISRQLQQMLSRAVHGQRPAYARFLTPVPVPVPAAS